MVNKEKMTEHSGFNCRNICFMPNIIQEKCQLKEVNLQLAEKFVIFIRITTIICTKAYFYKYLICHLFLMQSLKFSIYKQCLC